MKARPGTGLASSAFNRLNLLSWSIATGLAFQAQAQDCSVPYVVAVTECTIPPGTIVTVPANGTGVSASSLANVHADAVTANLNGANAVGLLVQTGAIIYFHDSVLRTTSTAGNASGQFGLRAIAAGSLIESVGSQVLLAPGGNKHAGQPARGQR